MNPIPLSEPCIEGNEWKYIKECLDTGWVSSVGSYVSTFEKTFASYIKRKYAVATINGTAALHLSLLASGVGASDEVMVPTLTFVATANTVRYCQATPVFMDCDPQTLCISTEKLEEFIKTQTIKKRDGYHYNKKSKKRIKALIPVHLLGHPADMGSIMPLCQKANITVIEDAAESLGSEYKNQITGSFGSMGCFSFNGNKIITTGGGGMAVTDDENLSKRIRHLSTQARTDSLEYHHDEMGYNYRLTNIQAALGVAQMEKLNNYLDIKRANAATYRSLLAKKDIELLWEKPWAKSNFWFYTLRVPKRDKAPLMRFLLSKKINVRPIWKLIHTLPMYKRCQAFHIESAPKAYEKCIHIPCSVSLKKEEIEYVVETIGDYFKN